MQDNSAGADKFPQPSDDAIMEKLEVFVEVLPDAAPESAISPVTIGSSGFAYEYVTTAFAPADCPHKTMWELSPLFGQRPCLVR